MFTFVISLLIFSFSHYVLCEGESNNGDERIVGGVEVNITSFPYQISLRYYGSHRCGGSILSPVFILTAAHCVDGIPTSALTIRAGSTDRTTGGQVRGLFAYVKHPSYNRYTFDYDYALIGLSSSLVYNSAVAPITMDSFTASAGTPYAVSGWGKLQQTDTTLPVNLRAVLMYIFDWNNCNWRYSYRLTNRMICATAPEKDSCNGDSGGPGIRTVNGQKLLTGVVSFGRGCNNGYYPSVYSNVAAARSWIRSYTGF